jgi:hypothetical protein
MGPFNIDISAYMYAMNLLNNASDRHTDVNLNDNQSNALADVVKTMLEAWADIKSEKYIVAYSTDPKKFIDFYKALRNGAIYWSKEDVQFFMSEYTQLVDIISLARYNKTSKELMEAVSRAIDGESSEDYE